MKKIIITLLICLGISCTYSCADSGIIIDPDSVSGVSGDSEEDTDRIYSYDFAGYYYATDWIDEEDSNDKNEKYQDAVNLRNGDYNKEDLDFEFQIVDNYNADYNGERYTVEIDCDNYEMRFISAFGEIEYYDIVWRDECNDFMFLRRYSSGGNPWYYVTKAAKID